MGNANSKAPEEKKGSDVPLPPLVDLHAQGSQGHNVNGNFDEYNPAIIPVAVSVDEIVGPTSPGLETDNKTEGTGIPHLEHDEHVAPTQHPLPGRTNVHQPGHSSLGNPLHHVASFLGSSTLTAISAYDLAGRSYEKNVPSFPDKSTLASLYATSHAESSSARESSHNDVWLNALGRDGSEFVPASTPTSDSQTTSAIMNDAEHYNLTDDKREQKNARRRAAYRKKRDEKIKLQNEKQNVSRPPLGDITNIDRPSGSMPDDEELQKNARRRTACRAPGLLAQELLLLVKVHI